MKHRIDNDNVPRSTVTVVDVLHNVDRFGRIFDCAVSVLDQSRTDTEICAISNDITANDLHSLMTFPGGNDIDLICSDVIHHTDVKKHSIYYLPDEDTLPYSEEKAECNFCNSKLTEALGMLYCPNALCPRRLYSRAEYLILVSSIPMEYKDLEDIKLLLETISTGNTFYPSIFVDLILPDYKTYYGDFLYTEDTRLYMTMFYRNIANLLHYYPGIEVYLSDLITFIMNMSIPGLRAQEIYRVASDAASVREHSYLFSYLANYLRSKDEVAYGTYIKELEEFSIRIHQFTDL